MAGLYLVGAWLLVQVASTLFPAFHVPRLGAARAGDRARAGLRAGAGVRLGVRAHARGHQARCRSAAGASIAPQTGQAHGSHHHRGAGLALVYFAFDKFVLAPKRAQSLAASPAATPAAVTPAADDNSIAVLPFVDMSQGKDQEYFSDGLSEELLNQLAQVPQLRVIARTSSFSFKGKEVGIADIARILKVGHVLEGSVRKSGNTLRITAQLIRTSDSSHLWSQTYDRSLDDVFKVQDEISREVVSALKLKLLPEKLPDNTQRTKNPRPTSSTCSARSRRAPAAAPRSRPRWLPSSARWRSIPAMPMPWRTSATSRPA
jgi:TolB-like protein